MKENQKRQGLSLGEAQEMGLECRIETIGVLRCMMGTFKRISKNKRLPASTRILARTLVPQIENEIHELKIRIENEKLGEMSF